MNKIILPVILFISVVLFGCNSQTKDPQLALNQFLDAVSKKDIATAKTLATDESAPVLDLMSKAMNMDSPSTELAKFDKNILTFEKPVIDGDRATIAATMKEGSEKINFSLNNVHNEWKVVFDMNYIMGAALEKINEQKATEPIPAEEQSNNNKPTVKKAAAQEKVVEKKELVEKKQVQMNEDIIMEREALKNAKVETKQAPKDARESKMDRMERLGERAGLKKGN